jgi:sugar lactone lactonase YvrE
MRLLARTRLAVLLGGLAVGAIAPAAADAAGCAGANPCPWTGTSSFGGFAATGLGYPAADAVDGSGNLWIADQSYNRIVELNGGAGVRLIGHHAGDGTSGSAGGEFNSPQGLALAGADVWVADTGNNRLQELNASTGAFIETVGWGVSDGASSLETCTSSCQAGIAGGGSGQFNAPTGVAIDAGGNVWVSDGYNNRVQELSSGGAFETAIGFGVTDGTYTFQTCTTTCRGGYAGPYNGQFNYPSAIAIDSNGIYVTDYYNHRVEEFGLVSPFSFAHAGGSYGFSGGQLYYPHQLSTDASGNVWVSDYSCRGGPQVFSATLAFVSSFNRPCGAAPGQMDGSAAIAFDGSGNSYLGDSFDRVQEFDATSTHNLLAGYSDPHYPASAVVLNGPIGLAYDAAGDLFIGDAGNNRVLKVNPSGTTVLARAGANTGDGGNGIGPGQFQSPAGLALDPTETFLYVTDQYGCDIQKLAASTLAYTGTFASSCGNGPGQLNGPRDIAVDGSGNVYVDEYFGCRIDEFDAAGAFVRRWGRQFGNGSCGTGPGEFSAPLGVGIDAQGNVVVADSNNNLMQTFSPTGTFLREFGSGGVLPGQFNSPRTPRLDAGGETVVIDPFNDRLETYAPDGTFLQEWGSRGGGSGQVSDNNGLAVVGQKLAVSNWDRATITTFTFPSVAAANTGVGAITTTDATVNATVDPGGGAAAYRWRYGPTSAYGSSTPVGVIGGAGPQAVSATIGGLDPGGTYHAQLVASSPGRSQTTQDFTFTTATGPSGGQGAQGVGGPPGAGGGTGVPGAQGATGPPGAKGQDGTASCRFAQAKKSKHARAVKYKFRCNLAHSARAAARAPMRLLRRGRVVASGTLRGDVMRIAAGHRLAPGRYTVEALGRMPDGTWRVTARYGVRLHR